MAGRQPLDFNLGQTRIQPTAAPVDTYSRPNAGSGLSQLAQSLQEVAPAVAKYSDVLAQQQSETQKAAGEQKAREMFESGVTYKDAIKKGLISPDESPWFQAGAKEQYGRVTAGQFSTDLQAAVAKDPNLQASTDVNQYDKFVSDFRKQWVADNIGEENRGLNFEHGFGSMADGYAVDSRRQFVAEAGQRLVKQVGDNHYGEVFQTVEHELQMGTTHTAIADGINLINERAVSMGLDATVANRMVVQALSDLAQQNGDPSVFDILKSVKAGGQTLEARPWAQKEIQETTHKIWEDKQQHHIADVEQQNQENKAHTEAEVGDMTAQWALSSDPSRLDFSKRIAQLAKTDWQAAQEMTRFQQTITTANFASNESTMQGALANIFRPEGDPQRVEVPTLVNLMNSRQINAQDFRTLKAQIDDRDNAEEKARNGGGKNPYSDPQFTHGLTGVAQQVQAGKPDEMWTPEVIRRVNGAQAEYGQAWLEYVAGAGKNANYLEKNKFLEEASLAITKKWQPPLTQKEAAQPGVPKVDLRSPQIREQVRSMANLIESQSRAGTGFSPGVITFLRRNNVTDVADFIKQYADK